MHPTNMPEPQTPHKGRPGAENTAQASRATPAEEPRQGGCAVDAGAMHCIPVQYCRGKSGLSRVELALLAYIMDHPEEQGARAAIAEDCGCAPNSIPRAAKKLESMGLIERTPGGGSERTKYRLGRNMQVTTRNMEVTRNTEVTTVETSTLPATAGVPQTETNTTDGVVTEVTGGRNIPPLEPPNNITPLVEANYQPSEPSFEGGLGELFDEPPAPKPRRASKRRPKREKFYASEDTMPAEPNEAMCEYAAERHLLNGERAIQFGKFRRYHITNRTLIASLEQRWETWVDNWAKSNRPVGANGAPKGLRFAGVGADGRARYVKDQRANVYR